MGERGSASLCLLSATAAKVLMLSLIRKLSISWRLNALLLICLALLGGIGALSWSAFRSVGELGVSESQAVLLEGEKERLALAVRTAAHLMSEELSGLDDPAEQEEKAHRLLSTFRYGPQKQDYLFAYRGTVCVSQKNPQLLGTDMDGAVDSNGVPFIRRMAQLASAGGFLEYEFDKAGQGPAPKLSYALRVKGTSFWVGTGVYIDYIQAKEAVLEARMHDKVVSFMTTIGVTVAFILLCVLLPLAQWTVRSIVLPLRQTVRVTKNVASGRLSASPSPHQDEVGQLETAVFEMVHHLTRIVREVNSGARGISEGASELQAAAKGLAEGSNRQAAAIGETSAATDEMSANIAGTMKNAQETDRLAGQAAQAALAGKEQVNETVEAMREITSKVGIIEEIARQTNLLALNAAIEAARAGSAGRGFAVVASEVRKLAERSASSAAEINELTKRSSQVAEQAETRISSIAQDVQGTSELVRGIASSNEELNVGATEISSALHELDGVVQRNAAAAEQLASSSSTFTARADALEVTMRFFELASESAEGGAAPTGDASLDAGLKKQWTKMAPSNDWTRRAG